jgi:hypothetical protein
MKEEFSKQADKDLDALTEVVASAKFKAGKIISDAEADLKQFIAGCALREIGQILKSQEFP